MPTIPMARVDWLEPSLNATLRDVKRLIVLRPIKNQGRGKSAFSALGAPMSLAWMHGSPHVEGLALPKSVESGKLSLNKAGIRWMSVNPSPT
jgi:hypothetical protein